MGTNKAQRTTDNSPSPSAPKAAGRPKKWPCSPNTTGHTSHSARASSAVKPQRSRHWPLRRHTLNLEPWPSNLAEDILHLVENPTAVRDIVHLHRLRKLTKKFLLLLRELLRCRHADLHKQIAFAALVQVWNALGAQLKGLAALRALGNLQRRRAFEGLNLQLCAQRGLRERDGHHAVQVVAVALKELVRLHAEDHIQIAGRPAEASCFALALVANARVLLDARRNLDE